MTRLTAPAFLVFLVAAVGLALALAGGRGSGPPPPGARPTTAMADWRPRPVEANSGWVGDAGEAAFDVRNCAVVRDLYDLAPARDEVAALTNPRLTSAAEASWLPPQAPVLGLKLGQEAHCYPLAILNWHSLVHDRVGGQTVYVLWDPPSGLGLARRVWAESRPLGLAGLGYHGVGLAYERAGGALWDLFAGAPISFPGKPVGFRAELKPDYNWLPLERMTWAAWRLLHGNTLVLSRDTGYAFDYRLDPYAAAAIGPGGEAEDYWTSDTLLAPESLRDATKALPDKDQVLGFLAQGEPGAISLRQLAEAGQAEVAMATASGMVTVRTWPEDDRALVTDAAGRPLPQLRLFWFVWKTRFPLTRLWAPPAETPE